MYFNFKKVVVKKKKGRAETRGAGLLVILSGLLDTVLLV